MSDSVDRVFVHALQTVRRLPRTGSSRPPPSSRLALYGLYKQSMEGDVSNILPRPVLPESSASSNLAELVSKSNPPAHRYASHDLRFRETQAEIEKWDAWHACAGMSRTDAKRKYITTLIDTMKVYASGTQESRELVGELEFVWGQIRSQSGSDEEDDSPTRSGMRPPDSYSSIPPDPSGNGQSLISSLRPEAAEGAGGDGGGEGESRSRGLRVLRPVSRGGSNEVIESEEVDPPPRYDDEHNDEHHDTASQNSSESDAQQFSDALDGSEAANALDRRRDEPHGRRTGGIDKHWRRRIESALSKMTAEIAALREQMADSRVFPGGGGGGGGAGGHRRLGGLMGWVRWLLWSAVRQLLIHLVLVLLFVVWGRWRGDRAAEDWVRRRWKSIRTLLAGLDLPRLRRGLAVTK